MTIFNVIVPEETAFSMCTDYFNDNDEGTILPLNKNGKITKQCN